MDVLSLSNLLAHTAQIACIVALATILSWLLRLDAAAIRYGYWRVTLALCLLLPLLQGRQTPAVPTGDVSGSLATVAEIAGVDPAGSGQLALGGSSILLPALAAGAIVRLVWILASLVRLSRLRRLGERASDSEVLAEMRQAIGVGCEIRYVSELRQPVTFGLRRPVVLLPAGLVDRRPEIQRAVVGHELFHVKRRDWAWLLAEEMVCALLWFNPAVWWLVSRVQLAREVVVDELTVLATGRRRAYVEALMSFADETSLAPVAAFGGRRQLFDRIVLLSKEAVMSSHRLVFTCAAMLAVLATGAWQAVSAFPLIGMQSQVSAPAGPGPLEQRARPITPENPIPRRTSYQAPLYPAEAQVAGAKGSIGLMITVDELGRVAEARRIRLSLTSTTPPVSLEFTGTTAEDERGFGRFVINGSVDQSNAVRAIAAAFTDAATRAVEQWRYDPPAEGPISFPVTVVFSGAAEGTASQGSVLAGSGLGARGTGAESPMTSDGAIRVGGSVKPPTKTVEVPAVYPPIAQSARVSGLVVLEIRIGRDGTVEEARVVRSIPLLDQAALDAVRQWRYTPTLMNGQPVPVIMTVTVNFALGDE